MFSKNKTMWGKPATLKSSYDVVIIGGGLHSLATAYYLAKEHGITDVAIIEKNYIGFGGAGRNTAILARLWAWRKAPGLSFCSRAASSCARITACRSGPGRHTGQC